MGTTGGMLTRKEKKAKWKARLRTPNNETPTPTCHSAQLADQNMADPNTTTTNPPSTDPPSANLPPTTASPTLPFYTKGQVMLGKYQTISGASRRFNASEHHLNRIKRSVASQKSLNPNPTPDFWQKELLKEQANIASRRTELREPRSADRIRKEVQRQALYLSYLQRHAADWERFRTESAAWIQRLRLADPNLPPDYMQDRFGGAMMAFEDLRSRIVDLEAEIQRDKIYNVRMLNDPTTSAEVKMACLRHFRGKYERHARELRADMDFMEDQANWKPGQHAWLRNELVRREKWVERLRKDIEKLEREMAGGEEGKGEKQDVEMGEDSNLKTEERVDEMKELVAGVAGL